MRTFEDIWAISAGRKGGDQALEAQLSKPKTAEELKATPDDRYLALGTKCIFQAGFNWKVVEAMWPGFEVAFEGFNIGHCLMLHDEDFGRLVSDERIVRHGPKIRAVQENARFFADLAEEHGSVGAFLADWPSSDYMGLLEALKKRGTRLGGNTGQYFLRFAGADSFILSQSVTNRLIAEGIVDKAPSSRKEKEAVQAAFNQWKAESGRSFNEISRVLGMSID
ncbi:DNA-3-methyladenine glycosylase I [Ensifer adhaerens]|nr:DNA-3-methyladenine glycosylase I [Ensifer adhaerens]